MALSLFSQTADIEETTMKMPTKPEDPAKRPQQSPERGAPASYAVHAVRKDVTVRVLVKPTAPAESEELREHGYGHGV
jgi:hypothetical protein